MAEAAEEKRRQSEAKRKQDYADLFNSDCGQRVLRDLMKRHCFFETTFAGERHATDFNEGRRYVVLEMLKLANAKEESRQTHAQEAFNAPLDYAVT